LEEKKKKGISLFSYRVSKKDVWLLCFTDFKSIVIWLVSNFSCPIALATGWPAFFSSSTASLISSHCMDLARKDLIIDSAAST